jgi:hypothetical protein
MGLEAIYPVSLSSTIGGIALMDNLSDIPPPPQSPTTRSLHLPSIKAVFDFWKEM